MDDIEIRRLVDELDAAVPKDDAKLLIYTEDCDQQTLELAGNRSGYLRAGIEMLRAALVPLGENQFITPIDIGYLGGQRSLWVKRLMRREDVEAALPPLRARSWKDQAIGVGCLMMVLFVCFCAITGFGDVMVWLLRK